MTKRKMTFVIKSCNTRKKLSNRRGFILLVDEFLEL